jgi:polyisoprenoid-binding protein YceI
MNRIWCAAAMLSLALLPSTATAADDVLTLHLDPAASSLAFVLDATLHKVDGRLGPASGRIAFDPATGAASGEIVIDLTGAETGNGRRDHKMHEKVLETGRHPVAVYRVSRINVLGPLRQGSNDVRLLGVLDLRGASHEVDVVAKAVLDGDRVTARGRLDVPYVDWGLHDPSFFVLRVAKQVQVDLVVAGRLEGELPAATAAQVP